MSDLAIGLRQVRAEQRAFWRNRAAALFGFGFPIMFLLIFGTIFNKQSTCVDGTIGASGQCVGGAEVPYKQLLRPGHGRLGCDHHLLLQPYHRRRQPPRQRAAQAAARDAPCHQRPS